MRIEVSMRQAQEQRMLLLPQMLQAIEILQLSSQDLLAMIDREMSENETLELAELTSPLSSTTETHTSPRDEDEWGDDATEGMSHEARPGRSGEEGRDLMGQLPAHQLSLHGHLIEQLALLEASNRVREIVSFLIGSLDRNGHLPLREEEIRSVFDTDAPVAEALEVLRCLDPKGIGQPGPRESMLAQLDPQDPDREYLAKLIREHLEDLAKNRLPKVARALSLSTDELKLLLPKLKVLDPCPGKAFQSEEAELLRPDIMVRREDGEWHVYVDDTRVPPLKIRPEYEALAKDKRASRQVRSYLRGKLGSARDLLASIEQRKETLGRVARAIVDRQKGFLDRGMPGLKPLKMQEIADAIGVHLSTVSRATAHKYIQTDFGIYPLRQLFDGGKPVGANGEGGRGEARASVKERLKRFIAAEDSKNPYSDDQLVKLLEEEGLKLSRRTVAKYRKELGIGSSWRRKEH